MIDRDATTEAYQILADLLVTIRRVFHRGLEKVSGKTWYLDGLPPGLFEKLVERKEREIAIDRFGGEYQELITFASLDDLASIIEHNKGLSRLLASLESDGSRMIERLREIEALRLKMAASVPFDDDDLEAITRYHREFRDSLTRRKRDNGAASESHGPQEATESGTDSDEVHVAEEEPDDAEDENAGAARGGAADGDSPEFATQAATFEEIVDVIGGLKADLRPDSDADEGDYVTRVNTPINRLGDASGSSNAGSLAVDVERAMAEDDDRKVLRILHTEVTGIAESAYRKMLDVGHPVWDAVRSSGWYDMKKAELALAPLELFYDVVARAGEVQRSGAGFEAVRDSLEDARFSKLLLSLREMFMRQSL